MWQDDEAMAADAKDESPDAAAPEDTAEAADANGAASAEDSKIDDLPLAEGKPPKKESYPQPTPEEFARSIYDVPVKVKAILGRVEMPVKDLVALKRGEVIKLNKRVGEPVEIWVNDRLVARGEVVLVEGILGVTLTELVKENTAD